MPEKRQIKRYGWRPSLPDHRDLVADPSGLDVLDEVDPRPEMPPVYDQGQLGSCTSNAVAAAVRYDRILDGEDVGDPSRLFVYYCERLLEGDLGEGDTGAMGRDGFKAAQQYGWPVETEWPYDITRYADDPGDQVWTDALGYRLAKEYRAVRRSLLDMKRVLSNRQTIAFGFSVYESFESKAVAETGLVPMPHPQEQMLGGHEVLCVGYLVDEPDYALCRNSWSADWGLDGYFLMPWLYLLEPRLSSDFRTIVRPVAA